MADVEPLAALGVSRNRPHRDETIRATNSATKRGAWVHHRWHLEPLQRFNGLELPEKVTGELISVTGTRTNRPERG